MKTSEKSILRIVDLKEQPASRFVLLPAGLDRVIIACDYYDVTEEVLTAYGPGGPEAGPIFCSPVAAGFVIVDRKLTTTESLLDMMKRMHGDEIEAGKIHAELEEAAALDAQPKPKAPGKIIQLRPDFEPPAAPTPHPGQYL